MEMERSDKAMLAVAIALVGVGMMGYTTFTKGSPVAVNFYESDAAVWSMAVQNVTNPAAPRYVTRGDRLRMIARGAPNASYQLVIRRNDSPYSTHNGKIWAGGYEYWGWAPGEGTYDVYTLANGIKSNTVRFVVRTSW